ncbi:MAG: hypothetical protein ACW96U_09155 [Candidatus Heimdallarchaeaceae archaeon]
MRKLSIELITQGASNVETKKILDDVAESLESYIIDTQPENLEKLEQNFGDQKQICDDNRITQSIEAAGMHKILISMFILCFAAIAGFGLSFLAVIPRFPLRYIQMEHHEALMNASSGGIGMLGTLFAINVFTWIIYYYFGDKFSKHDFRAAVREFILAAYWYIVLIWIGLFIAYYSRIFVILPGIWKNNMKFLVVEGIIKWIFLGAFLITTAILYTKKYIAQKTGKSRDKSKSFAIDNLSNLVGVFVLTGFIVPSQGVGVLILLVGIATILLSKMNGRILFLGSAAILIQLLIPAINLRRRRTGYSVIGKPTIIGIKISNESASVITWKLILVYSLLLLVWISVGIILIRRNEGKILPSFRIKWSSKNKTSYILIFLIVFSILGSQSQEISLNQNITHSGYDWDTNTYTVQASYHIPTRGKIYVTLYEHANITFHRYFSNGTLNQSTSYIIEGYWHLNCLYYSAIGIYESTKPSNTFIQETEWVTVNVSVRHIVINADGSGGLDFEQTVDSSSLGIPFPMRIDVRWVGTVPWFPSWVEISIAATLFLSFFLSWDKEKLIKTTTVSRKEEK